MHIVRASFLSLLASVSVWAQTAQIGGTVKDSTGSIIPGAEIKATQTATGAFRTSTSGADGGFVIPNLPIGPYMLEVTKTGFQKYVQTGIVLEVGTAPTANVIMTLGSVNEQITVQAEALQVETRDSGIGQVVDTQRVLEMPLNGRDPHELVFLAGMANYPGQSSLQSVRNYPTVVVSVAGGVPDAVAYLLDGTIYQDPYNNLSLPLPFPDALQEFKVETSGVQPQYGYHSTANVNAVTKSGTNKFHGDAFEFLRNGDLNARDFFAKKRDTLKRNQYGGTVGGPIKKDKLFFFGGFQRTNLRSDSAQNTAFIPTQAMVTGDFTAITSPGCNSGKQINLPASLGFNNNTISPSLLNTVALNIVKTMPVTTDPCGRVLYGLAAIQDENLGVAKIDYQINEKQSMFGRYTVAQLNVGSTFDGKDPLSLNTFGVNDLDYSITLGHTWVPSPTWVNAFRVGGSRTNVAKIPDNYASWPSLGANISPLAGNVIAITATPEFSIGGVSASPGASHNGPLLSFYDDVSWIRGTHQVMFGGSFYRQMLNYFSGPNAIGTPMFDGSISGAGGGASVLSDFMLGRPATFSQGTLYGFYSRQKYMALYIQDSWKITSRLTLNYGVRWEPSTPVFQKTVAQDEHFDQGLFNQGIKSSYYTNAPVGLVVSGDPQYSCGNYFYCPQWDKFFPRVGLAFDPVGDGKTTIRVAYGMLGDRPNMLALSQEQFSPPFGNLIAVSGSNLTNPWTTFAGLPGFSPAGQNPMALLAAANSFGHQATTIPFPTAGSYVTAPLTQWKAQYVNQWNLSLQRQLGTGWLVSANYLGTSTIHLISGENINAPVLVPNTAGTPLGTCPAGVTAGCNSTTNYNQRRPLYLQNPATGVYYAGVGFVDPGGTAEFAGLNLSLQKRVSHGLNLLANYTWSHCISDPWNNNPTNGGVAPPGNRRQWRANCVGIDLRQNFTLSAVYNTPRFDNKVARLLASDWQLAPILTIRSAQQFSVLAGPDRALTSVAGQPAQYLGGNPYNANQTVDHWLNTSAFALPALGTYGNLGLNNLKGPGAFQLNLALSRNFKIHESQTLQIRADAFNLPNHLNPYAPGNGPIGGASASQNFNASNFGQITNDISGNNGLQAGDYRVVQLAMKFIF